MVLIAVVMFILLALGVLRYRSSQDEVTLTIDKQKGREATEQAIEKGRELGSKIAEQAKGTFERSDVPAPQPTGRDH